MALCLSHEKRATWSLMACNGLSPQLWKPGSPVEGYAVSSWLSRGNNLIYFFQWRSSCFVVGFCLPKLRQSRASKKSGHVRAVSEGWLHVPCVYREMIASDIFFGVSLFGEGWGEMQSQGKEDQEEVRVKKLNKHGVGIILAVVI